jgi:LysM repeat protein
MALVALVVGVPTVLTRAAAYFRPSGWPSWTDVWAGLSAPDDGTIVAGLLLLAGWIAWIYLMITLLSEVVARFRRGQVPDIVVLHPGQLVARVLVGAVVTLFMSFATSPPTATADTTPPGAESSVAAEPLAVSPPGTDGQVAGPSSSSPPPRAVVGEVTPRAGGSTSGSRGPVSGSSVPTSGSRGPVSGTSVPTSGSSVPTPGSSVPTSGAATIQTVPPVTDAASTAPNGPSTVTVRAGDTLFGLAAQHLGDGERWPELFAVNRHMIADPDQIEPGWVLALRPPDFHPTTLATDTSLPPADTSLPPAEVRLSAGEVTLPAAEVTPPRDLTSSAGGSDTAGPSAPATILTEPRATPVPFTMPAGRSAPVVSEPPAVTATGGPATVGRGVDDGLDTPVAPLRTWGGVGSILAAGVLVVLGRSRARQFWRRPPGTPVPTPAPGDAREEDYLRMVASRDLVWHADRALRSLAAGCAAKGVELPALRAARVTEDELQIFLAEPAALPRPWARTADDAVWVCPFDAVAAPPPTPSEPLTTGTTTTVEDPLRGVQAPYPALVCVGQDTEDAHLLVDLEQIGTLGLVGPSEVTWEAMAAMAVELSTSAWADDISVTTVDGLWGVEDIFHTGCLRHTAALTPLLSPLSHRADADREAFITAGVTTGRSGGLIELHRARLRGVAGDAWYPEVFALFGPTTASERSELRGIIAAEPRVAVAALTTSEDLMGDYRIEFLDDGQAILQPFGLPFTPQRLPRSVLQAMGRVIAVADEVATEPEGPATAAVDDSAWAQLVARLEDDSTSSAVSPLSPADSDDAAEPYLRVLGPVEVHGATGVVEPSKVKRLTEYLAFIVLNPPVTAAAIDEAIWPNRGREDNASTRNTATSKLRKWLGDDATGRPYLPPFSYACTGVGSDWADWNALVGGQPLGQVPTDQLDQALSLVHGRPFMGVNRRGYRWADRLQQSMIVSITDVCWELARRSYNAGDYRRTDRALTVALGVSPGDEALWRLRIAACHAAGDHEGEQAAIDAVYLIAADLGCDLDAETLDLISQLQREHTR